MSDPSHSNKADPDYSVVFPDDQVNTITISISRENWQKMLDNMTELYGEFGANTQGAMQGQGGDDRVGGQGIGGMSSTVDPVYVPADVSFNAELWENVGIRFKGFNSLQGSWRDGSYKISFKLNFDKFEDDYPEIKNQRFYGFDELNLQNNYNDDSLMRDMIVPSIFRESGVVAPYTAYYRTYVDYGEGPIYFGLYTMIEAIEDTVIETQFADDSGNLYKPEGNGASFVEGTFDTSSFEKKTNEDEEDWSDVEELYAILNSDTRLTNPDQWRTDLEAVFDVDIFLRWLATNTVIQNWDTYGGNCRNFYLYTDPTDGRIKWIPWDNNYALSSGMNAGNQIPADIPENNQAAVTNESAVQTSVIETLKGTKNEFTGNDFGRNTSGSAVQQFLENRLDGASRLAMSGFGLNTEGTSLKAAPGDIGAPPSVPDWNASDIPDRNDNGGGMNRGGGMGSTLSLSLDEVGDNWPLIRYIADDPVYYAQYQNYLERVVTTSFEPVKMEQTYLYYHSLIEPYVTGVEGEKAGYTHLSSPENFDTSLDELIGHVYGRYDAVMEYLAPGTTPTPTPTPTATPTATPASLQPSRLNGSSPKVTIISPASSGVVTPGQEIDITWSATANTDITSLVIEYSVNGRSWINVADSLPDGGTYTLEIPSVSGSLFMIRITATDESGSSGSASKVLHMSQQRPGATGFSSSSKNLSATSALLREDILGRHGITQSANQWIQETYSSFASEKDALSSAASRETILNRNGLSQSALQQSIKSAIISSAIAAEGIVLK